LVDDDYFSNLFEKQKFLPSSISSGIVQDYFPKQALKHHRELGEALHPHVANWGGATNISLTKNFWGK
jgi:hypothetical protein